MSNYRSVTHDDALQAMRHDLAVLGLGVHRMAASNLVYDLLNKHYAVLAGHEKDKRRSTDPEYYDKLANTIYYVAVGLKAESDRIEKRLADQAKSVDNSDGGGRNEDWKLREVEYWQMVRILWKHGEEEDDPTYRRFCSSLVKRLTTKECQRALVRP